MLDEIASDTLHDHGYSMDCPLNTQVCRLPEICRSRQTCEMNFEMSEELLSIVKL